MAIKRAELGKDKNTIILELDFLPPDKAEMSASGKSKVAATTSGFDWNAFKGLGISANVIYSNRK